MAGGVSDHLISELSQYIGRHMGLHFPEERRKDLERGVAAAAKDFGFKDTDSCVEWLLSAPLTKRQIETLASHLTVGETYFFREKNSFDALEKHIFPELIRQRGSSGKNLRVWSAGCCTGEEPYSVSILLDSLIPDLKNWNITILATDISPRFIEKGARGVYGDWSFRDAPSWLKERYFTKTKEGRFEVLSRIKNSVTFSYLNLVEDSYPSLTNNTNAMDVILCRNVLMYFDQACAKKVARNLSRSLVEGGWLIVSPSEASANLFAPLKHVNFPGAVLYKKEAGAVPAEEAPPFVIREEVFIPTPPEVAFPERAEEKVFFPEPVEEKKAPELSPVEEAVILFKKGSYAEAEKKLLEICSGRRDNAEAAALLARTYANQGKLEPALQWCASAVAADKVNPAYHYLQAVVLQELGRLEDSAAAFKKVLYLDHNFALAHFSLGNLSLRKGSLKESKKYFDNAYSILSRFPKEEILPESDGITAGRLMEIIESSR